MKTKIIYFLIILLPFMSSCSDFLDVTSESQMDNEFVFSTETDTEKALLGTYGYMQAFAGIHSNYMFYEVISAGSDIEVGPENPTTGGGRYLVCNLYPNNNYSGVGAVVNNGNNTNNGQWNSLYRTVNLCNIIIEGIEESALFQAADKTKPSAITHMYGEAVTMRAIMYYELTRMWGDVIYSTKPFDDKKDYDGVGITNRDLIQEGEIEKLKEVEPMMYYLGQSSYNAERITRGVAQGMIGRLALIRGGYSLRPASYQLQSGDETKQSDGTWGKLVRRGDYLSYYQLAIQYLEKCRDSSGASLITTDGRVSPNPFQLVFQKMMDLEVSSESLFEIAQMPGVQSERPYAFGRPSVPSSNSGYPGKAYGQVRFYPTFYYDEFSPKDLRRDVTVAVTANQGTGSEQIMSLMKGNRNAGGLALNKWDQSRMKDPSANTSRQTGINAPYMRYADILLLLSEAYYVTGNEGSAKTELLKVRARAFDKNDADYNNLVTNYVNSKSGETLYNAIQEERKFELAGEGMRKYDLVRWGNFGEKINNLQSRLKNMVEDLESSGSHTFASGSTISTYIWTKNVKWSQSRPWGLTDMLTGNCDVDASSPLYPVKFPGWRGNYSKWTITTDDCYSLAIQGLFNKLSDSEIAQLEADGYKKTDWASNIVSQRDFWLPVVSGIFGGYLPSDYAANKPPRYILPLPSNEISTSKGVLHNEYGFPDAY